MWPSILSNFIPFTDRFEGCLSFMYLDVKGLVTTGRGDLIDSWQSAAELPWLHTADSTPASASDVQAAWSVVKGRQDMRTWGGERFKGLTDLFLPQRAIDAMTYARINASDIEFSHRWCNYSTLCADAQMGIQSLGWACGICGVEFDFPKFDAAISRNDFQTAAQECIMNAQGNPGLIPRNKANQALFTAAASVLVNNLDPSVLHGWSQY